MTERKVNKMTNDTLVKKTAIATKTKWIPAATDRCDRCGESSRAYVRATKGAAELFFCRHHYNDHQAELITQEFEIEDRTDILEDECAKYKAVSDDNF